MAKRSVNLVSSGHIAITPKSMEASWARWLGLCLLYMPADSIVTSCLREQETRVIGVSHASCGGGIVYLRTAFLFHRSRRRLPHPSVGLLLVLRPRPTQGPCNSTTSRKEAFSCSRSSLADSIAYLLLHLYNRLMAFATGRGCVGHLVLFRYLSSVCAWLAERHRRSPAVLPSLGNGDWFRHSLLLGRSHEYAVHPTVSSCSFQTDCIASSCRSIAPAVRLLFLHVVVS